MLVKSTVVNDNGETVLESEIQVEKFVEAYAKAVVKAAPWINAALAAVKEAVEKQYETDSSEVQ